MSATWNAARIGVSETSVPAVVIDTETAAGAQALVVLAAAQAAAAGADRRAVEAVTLDVVGRVRLVAVIDGLD